MLIAIGVILSLVSPLVPIVLLWQAQAKSKFELIIMSLFGLSFFMYIYIIARWDWLSNVVRYALLIFLLAAIWRAYRRTDRNSPFFRRDKLAARSLTSYLVPTVVFMILSFSAIRGFFYSEMPSHFVFPLKSGVYYVAQGGGAASINVHHPYGSQSFALDIVKLNAFGGRASGLYPSNPERYAIWGDAIYCPCDGMVLQGMDGVADLPPGAPGNTRDPAGNHVYIACGDYQVLIAHLIKGSLMVQKGQAVRAGDQIGRVGNSGNTSEPHLHIHVQKDGDLVNSISGVAIPVLFNNRFLVRNDLVIVR